MGDKVAMEDTALIPVTPINSDFGPWSRLLVTKMTPRHFYVSHETFWGMFFRPGKFSVRAWSDPGHSGHHVC